MSALSELRERVERARAEAQMQMELLGDRILAAIDDGQFDPEASS